MVRVAVLLALLVGLDGRAPYRVRSIRTLDRENRSLAAYRLTYAIGGEWPPPSIEVDAVVREKGAARVDAMVRERNKNGSEVGELGVRLDSRHSSRALTDPGVDPTRRLLGI